MKRDAPVRVATRPSRLVAVFNTTQGLSGVVDMERANGARSAVHACAASPSATTTSIPAARKRVTPRPSTRGLGSRVPTTTVPFSLERGVAVLVISTDFEEIAHICNRALVFNRGRVSGELLNEEVTFANLLHLACADEVPGKASSDINPLATA